jgi:imidazoleglycerol-phosphate dehydratase
MRTASLERTTRETSIVMTVDLDGAGRHDVRCPISFLGHMLETLARHSGFDIRARIKGDLKVGQHHTAEDTGLVLGGALRQALGSMAGILRAGCFLFPMDESLAWAAIDFSGRPFLMYRAQWRGRKVGDLEAGVIEDFFAGLSRGLEASLHLQVLYGRSDHHRAEALFKAAAKALRQACALDERLAGILPSTKEVL